MQSPQGPRPDKPVFCSSGATAQPEFGHRPKSWPQFSGMCQVADSRRPRPWLLARLRCKAENEMGQCRKECPSCDNLFGPTSQNANACFCAVAFRHTWANYIFCITSQRPLHLTEVCKVGKDLFFTPLPPPPCLADRIDSGDSG